jgi:hypothetical protein
VTVAAPSRRLIPAARSLSSPGLHRPGSPERDYSLRSKTCAGRSHFFRIMLNRPIMLVSWPPTIRIVGRSRCLSGRVWLLGRAYCPPISTFECRRPHRGGSVERCRSLRTLWESRAPRRDNCTGGQPVHSGSHFPDKNVRTQRRRFAAKTLYTWPFTG